MKKQLLCLVVALCFAGMTVQAQQRLVLVEEFTASTCGPCATVNAWFNPLLVTNADKVVVVKYQMNWPGIGDPYYTAEGGQRRTYYGVSGVPTIFVNGTTASNNSSAVQNAINNGYALPAQADITGVFRVDGNMIYVKTTVTPLISGDNFMLHCIVDEKLTTGNAVPYPNGNGETQFHHVMMKMFPDGNGTLTTITANDPIVLNFSHDMSTTHVEEMNDLEVAVFAQNKTTKAILNAAYLVENNTLPLPPTNIAATQEEESLNINLSWAGGKSADGYNVYRNGVKLNSTPVTETTYSDAVPEYGITYNYAIASIVDGVEGFWGTITGFANITIPLPINVTVKQTRGMEMLITWEMPAGFEHPVKYYVYRNNIPQNSGNPTPETTFENKGLSYRDYCFEIGPILNEITGDRSAEACITLINVPAPNSLKAEQVSTASKEVLLTWDGSASNTAGYNIYRDDVQINTELVTEKTYTDVVAEYEVKYTYEVFGVAGTGAESEKSATTSITLYSNDLPVPQNVQAKNDDFNVSVTWDAITDIDGYNVYRNDEQINTALVTVAEYSDLVSAEGNYCYKITSVVEGEESGKSEPACVDIITIGISETAQDVFTLYPNPVSGTLNIDTKETITDCQVFNLQGQLIYSTRSGAKEIATDGWASGIYIIRVTTEKGSAEKRVVKN